MNAPWWEFGLLGILSVLAQMLVASRQTKRARAPLNQVSRYPELGVELGLARVNPDPQRRLQPLCHQRFAQLKVFSLNDTFNVRFCRPINGQCESSPARRVDVAMPRAVGVGPV